MPHYVQSKMGLLARVNIHSLSGYAQHVCQLLGISHFNAGALVFCDGRTKHELTRDTESTLWFFRIPILLDFMMQNITLTGLTRLLTVLLWLMLICNMIDAERMGLGFDPPYCSSSFFLVLASIHMPYGLIKWNKTSCVHAVWIYSVLDLHGDTISIEHVLVFR